MSWASISGGGGSSILEVRKVIFPSRWAFIASTPSIISLKISLPFVAVFVACFLTAMVLPLLDSLESGPRFFGDSPRSLLHIYSTPQYFLLCWGKIVGLVFVIQGH